MELANSCVQMLQCTVGNHLLRVVDMIIRISKPLLRASRRKGTLAVVVRATPRANRRIEVATEHTNL